MADAGEREERTSNLLWSRFTSEVSNVTGRFFTMSRFKQTLSIALPGSRYPGTMPGIAGIPRSLFVRTVEQDFTACPKTRKYRVDRMWLPKLG
jgi:hypothetical protein